MFKSITTTTFKRSITYSLPRIPLLEDLRTKNQNFKGLFQADTLQQLWFKRGEFLINDLNHLLIENQLNIPNNLPQLIKSTINRSEFSRIYSDATLLYNLQFFFESLKEGEDYEFPKLTHHELLKSPSVGEDIESFNKKYETKIVDEELRNWLISSFGSILEFKTLLLDSANAINGDGITWVIAQPNISESLLKNSSFSNSSNEAKYSKLSIVNTYNAGTVDDSIRSGQISKLNQQKKLKQDLKAEQQQELGTAVNEAPTKDEPSHILGTVEEAELAKLYSDKKIVPLLAIDGSTKNYLLDYGVFGKQQYLENIWNCINWDVVKQRSPKRFIANFSMDY